MACCLSINIFFLFAVSVAGARKRFEAQVLGVFKVAAADVEKEEKAAEDAHVGYQEADGARKAANQNADAATKNRETAATAARNGKPLEASEAEEAAKANAALADKSLKNAQAGCQRAQKAKEKSMHATHKKMKLRNNLRSQLANATKDKSETLSALGDAKADLEVKKADADVASQAIVGITSLVESVKREYQAAKDTVDEAAKRANQSIENAQKTVSEQSKVLCLVKCLSENDALKLKECMYFQCGISLLTDAAEDAAHKIIKNPATDDVKDSVLTGPNVTDQNLTGPNGTDHNMTDSNLTGPIGTDNNQTDVNHTDNLTGPNGTDNNQTDVNHTDNLTEVERAANRVYVTAGKAIEAATSIVPASHTAWYLNESVKVRISIESKNYSLSPEEQQKAAEIVGEIADKALNIAEESSEKLDSAQSFLASAESALNDVEESCKSLTTANDEAKQALKAARIKFKELREQAAGQDDAVAEISSELQQVEDDVKESHKYTNSAKNSYNKAENARQSTEVARNTAKNEATRAGKCRAEAQRLKDCHDKCDDKDFLECKFAFNKDKCIARHQGLCKVILCRKKFC